MKQWKLWSKIETNRYFGGLQLGTQYADSLSDELIGVERAPELGRLW